jgi:glycolate oxidase
MIPEHVLQELSGIVGPRHLKTLPEDLTDYSRDATKLEFMPDAVAFPGNAEEISQILTMANREGFPVIPRGAGSGISGGALPTKGGLVLTMDRFNRILSIDQDNLITKVESGVITARLQEEVEKVGLFYPPDPASVKISSIGGNVAECAGGLRAVKYGVTRDYVLGLAVVLPTGEIIQTGVETAKGVVGYDLTRLIVGSEGTLAIVTSVTLRLIPKPATKRTMMSFFPDVLSAVQAVSKIIHNRIVPSVLEFMDKLSIDCVREETGLPIPRETGALLLIEVDGHEDLVPKEAKSIEDICTRSGATHFQTSSGEEEAERLWEARRNASPSMMRLRPNKVSEDVVVPRTRLPELVLFLSQLGKKYGVPIPAFGHAGDGNLHVNIMFDENVREEKENVHAVVKDLFRKVIKMGGTISGEHGIGITKAPYLDMEIPGPSLDLMARIKKAFDPNNILNPGKIFPQIHSPSGLHPSGSK